MTCSTSQAILDAAERLIATHGATGWTMSELARAAHTSRGSLYRRYASSQEVLAALATQRDVDVALLHTAPLRERVLHAVSEEARRVGIAHVSIAQIATLAHVGEATVYRHFSDRKGLLAAWAEERSPLAALRALSSSPPEQGCDARATLSHMLEHALRFELEHGISRMSTGQPDEDSAEIIALLLELERAGRAMLRHQLAAFISQGSLQGNADVLTASFIGMVPGVLLHFPALDDARLPDLVSRCIDHFLHGCSPPPRISP